MIRYSRATARDSRVKSHRDNSLGILTYGTDNLYPMNALDMVDKSGTASICVDQLTNFLVGEGFDIVGDVVINDEGETMNDLLRMIAKDFSSHKGFSFHVSFNGMGRPTQYRYIDFAKMRLPVEPENNDWMVYMPNLGESFDNKDPNKTIKIPRYNMGKVIGQLEDSSGIDSDFMGQVFWYSAAGKFTYPLPQYGAVIEDMNTEYGLMVSKNSGVNSGFSARHLMYYNDEFENDADFDEFVGGIKEYSGPEQQGSIIVLETKKKGMIELVKIEQSDNAEALYKYTEESASNSIRESFAIPPVLIGKYPSGSLGSSREYTDSVLVYNMITRNPRTTIASQLSKVFEADLTINPLSFDDFITPETNGTN